MNRLEWVSREDCHWTGLSIVYIMIIMNRFRRSDTIIVNLQRSSKLYHTSCVLLNKPQYFPIYLHKELWCSAVHKAGQLWLKLHCCTFVLLKRHNVSLISNVISSFAHLYFHLHHSMAYLIVLFDFNVYWGQTVWLCLTFDLFTKYHV